MEGEEPMTVSGGSFVGSGVRNARKTVRWTVFSGERAAAQGICAGVESVEESSTNSKQGFIPINTIIQDIVKKGC